MSKQIDFLKRCIALNLQSGGLLDLPDRIEELERERDALQADNAELVAALKPFGAIDLVESRLPAEFAMLILRARAAIAKVKGQS